MCAVRSSPRHHMEDERHTDVAVLDLPAFRFVVEPSSTKPDGTYGFELHVAIHNAFPCVRCRCHVGSPVAQSVAQDLAVDEIRLKFAVTETDDHVWFSIGRTVLDAGKTSLTLRSSVRRLKLVHKRSCRIPMRRVRSAACCRSKSLKSGSQKSSSSTSSPNNLVSLLHYPLLILSSLVQAKSTSLDPTWRSAYALSSRLRVRLADRFCLSREPDDRTVRLVGHRSIILRVRTGREALDSVVIALPAPHAGLALSCATAALASDSSSISMTTNATHLRLAQLPAFTLVDIAFPLSAQTGEPHATVRGDFLG